MQRDRRIDAGQCQIARFGMCGRRFILLTVLNPTDRSQRTDRMASMQADETGSVTAPFSSPSEMCPCTAAQPPRP